MRHLSRRFAAPLATLALLSFTACDSGSQGPTSGPADPSIQLNASKDQITIGGSVTVGGKAMTSGEVLIDPKTSSRSDVEVVKATIGSDGTYSAKTYVGTNNFQVTGPDMTDQQKGKVTSKLLEATDTKFDVVIP